MLVKHIMTEKVITIPSDTPIPEVKKIMKENKIRRLPVVDDGARPDVAGRAGR